MTSLRTRLPCFAIVVILAAVVGTSAASATESTWRLEQPPAPAPPPGAAPAPFPVPLGSIGDIEFQAPNRGVLITGGTDVVPKGLYAYDGVSWHLLATVCGGTNGRVAWAGPTDLWTVSDQRLAQTTGVGQVLLNDRSLCHVSGGSVTASYARPVGLADSYMPMSGAACRAPTDCWFGGDLLRSPPPYGAFHLRWDGAGLTSIPSPAVPVNDDPAHAVQDLIVHQGRYYESVRIENDDPVNLQAGETLSTPARIHMIAPELTSPFISLMPALDLGKTATGAAVRPTSLDGFRLSSDGSRLWAVAGSAGNAVANLVILTLSPSGLFKQVKPKPNADGSSAFSLGIRVTSIAADPGTDAVWIAYATAPSGAQVARIAADGTVTRDETLPAPGDPAGPKGRSDKVACPATDDCWLSTDRGWLFHLTDGTPRPRDTDPAMAGVITDRPSDGGIPYVPPIDDPTDDSLANARPAGDAPVAPIPPADPATPRPTKAKALVRNVTSRLLRHTTTLEVRFRLIARARVRVIAKRKGKVVARSKLATLRAGNRVIKLRLSRRHWPTGLAIDATATAPANPTVQARATKTPLRVSRTSTR